LPSLGVLPVKIRLLGAKEVQIVLLCMLVPLPDAAGKVADPVIGSLAFAIDIASRSPDVPIAFGIVFRGSGLQEPFVLCIVSSFSWVMVDGASTYLV
jgi:hypothetical protein